MNGLAVETARGWIGTPYRHQAACRGAGADCLGLVRGVWREIVGPEPVSVPAYTPGWDEVDGEERLWAAARTFLVPRSGGPLAPGDVVLFRMAEAGPAKHLGIVGEGDPDPTVIHAYSRHAVVETHLSRPWRRRIVAVFEFPKGNG